MSFRLSKILLLVTALSLAMALLAVLLPFLAASQEQTAGRARSACIKGFVSYPGLLQHCALGVGSEAHTPRSGPAGELLPATDLPVLAHGHAVPQLHIFGQEMTVHDLAGPAVLVDARSQPLLLFGTGATH